MKVDELNNRHYTADENKTFVRVADKVRMSNDMYLAEIDSIDNYKEEKMTAEEIKELEEKAAEEKARQEEMKKKH